MKSMLKFATLSLTLTSLLTALPAHAEGYPEKPIEIVVTYAAGGLTDTFARKIASFMPKYLPNEAKVVVVNKPGGAGTIGLTKVANAKADGYTLAYTTSSPIAMQPLYGKTPFKSDSFVPVAKLFEIPAAFNVHKDSDIKTLDDLKAYVAANPDKFTYASTGGKGSGTHLVSTEFAKALGIKIRHVPYEGSAAMKTALSGKQVMGTMEMPNLHRGGDARPLIFLTKIKPSHEAYKEVPTSQELDIAAVTEFFAGILAPAGTPADRVAILEAAFEKSMQEPEVSALFEKTQIPLAFAGSADFAEIIKNVTAANKEQLMGLGLIK